MRPGAIVERRRSVPSLVFLLLAAACDRRGEAITAVAEERAPVASAHAAPPVEPSAAVASASVAPGGAAAPVVDPARIEGTWSYRTESNCGKVPGLGEVSFAWNAGDAAYDENGVVHWSDSGSTIRWWGSARHDAARRRLAGRMKNSLGDTVDGDWELEGEGPDRLVVRWVQTNGCHGTGVATRKLDRGAR